MLANSLEDRAILVQPRSLAFALPLLASLAAGSAAAQEVSSFSVIDDNALEAVSGVAHVNQSAGDANLQLNGAAVVINDTGASIGIVSFVQSSATEVPSPDTLEVDAVSIIDDDAFANVQGLLSVNQASGLSNQQANLVTMALGVDGEIVAEAELSQTRTDGQPAADFEPDGVRHTHIDDGAFRDASGVVQVNQVAGVSNSTFNRFALSLAAGSGP